nr:hypothetical protein [Tanacetum cinerariifolium]
MQLTVHDKGLNLGYRYLGKHNVVPARITAEQPPRKDPQMEYSKIVPQSERKNMVESSKDEESLGEDASKKGRIEAIDQDEDITLVNVQDDVEMLNVNDLGDEEVFVAKQEVVSTAATTITTEELTLSQVLKALKTLNPKVKGIVIQEQEEPGRSTTTSTISKQPSQDRGKGTMIEEPTASTRVRRLFDAKKATLFVQLLEKRRKHFVAKRAEDKRNKPQTQAQKRKIMYTYIKSIEGYTLKQLKSCEFDKIQEMFDRAFKSVNTFGPIRSELVERKEKRAEDELIQESTKKQKVEDDKETTKLNQLLEIIQDKEEIVIDAIPLVVKSPRIVTWKIHKGRKEEKLLSNSERRWNDSDVHGL